MIADSLVYSRMRYWAQCMAIPPKVNEWIEEDVQAMIWNKEPTFQPDEDGAKVENRRFMRNGAQYNDKEALGLGLINWKDHVRAIQVKALLWSNLRNRRFILMITGCFKTIFFYCIFSFSQPAATRKIMSKTDSAAALRTASPPVKRLIQTPHIWENGSFYNWTAHHLSQYLYCRKNNQTNLR